jgi:hypothetical protein
MNARQITVEWADVKRRFVASVRDGERWGQAMQSTLRGLHDSPYRPNDWAGGSGADTLGWLDDGFRSADFEEAAIPVPVAEKVRVGWHEEDGDVDLGRLYGGYDDFYLKTSPSETRPGLKVTADCFFAASVSPATVRAYGAFVAKVIGTLEAQGYDLEVELAARVTALSDSRSRSQRDDVCIKVKRPGELSDFTDWSALFAPTGVRHLVFTAFGVASEKVGEQQTSHMAMSLERSSFDVTYDADANHLRITGAQRSSTVDEQRMTDALLTCGLI